MPLAQCARAATSLHDYTRRLLVYHQVLLWFVELYVFLGHCAVPEVLLAMLL
jgi:hypothetical protein